MHSDGHVVRKNILNLYHFGPSAYLSDVCTVDVCKQMTLGRVVFVFKISLSKVWFCLSHTVPKEPFMGADGI